MQDGGMQDGCIELKMAISQFRLNLERVYVRFLWFNKSNGIS